MAVKKQFSSFPEMLESSTQPILVDFYATWCGPCQMMSQILDQVNIQMGNRIQIVKIDSDKYPVLASQYGVQALPTLILFKNGQLIQKLEGVMQAPQLTSYLQSLI
jgi:thioredoxin